MKLFSIALAGVGLASATDVPASRYLPLEGCAVEEGASLHKKPYKGCDVLCCQKKCDETEGCQSISIFGVAKVCYLKDACVKPDAEIKINKYTTWYKSCGEDADVALDETLDPRTKSGIQADETSPVTEILRQIHSWCIEELYTDKWKSKSGALMGSVNVKKNMEDPHSTRCSNADWRQAINKLDLTDDVFSDLFDYSDPCQAASMYHLVGSGIGSWMSNLANVMYTHASDLTGAKTSLAFRDQKNRTIEKWELLLGHEIPMCMTYAKKSTPFVRPDKIERLKQHSTCDYAAAKGFFVKKMWEAMQRGPLGADIEKAVAKHVAAIRRQADPESGGGRGEGWGADARSRVTADVAKEFSGAFIGVHLRHKWEFKLQPPKLVDVATLLKATAAQVNPFENSEITSADPSCFADEAARARVWGARTTVFCGSDEVEACHKLQTLLGEDFNVYSVDNLKINSGKAGIVSYLTDVALLAKATIFVGAGSSNLSRLVNALRGPDKMSLSMDIDFNTVHF